MSPPVRTFLVRRLRNGHMATVQAYTARGAMDTFLAKATAATNLEVDEEVMIKERGAPEWEVGFRLMAGGKFRKVA